MMYLFLVIIHVIVSIFLIAVILFQAGRGGGLADTFGGSQMQSLFGTRSTAILARLTTICASVFILTCLSLALIASRTSKSLMERVGIPAATAPVSPFVEDVSISDVEEEYLPTEEIEEFELMEEDLARELPGEIVEVTEETEPE